MTIQLFKGRTIDKTKKISVYRNLHNNMFSIKQGGLVVAHTNKIALRGVTFHVSEKGREKVLQEKKKNVHAYVKGYMCPIKPLPGERKEVYYNPYKVSSFMLENNALHECNYMVLCNNRMYKVGE